MAARNQALILHLRSNSLLVAIPYSLAEQRCGALHSTVDSVRESTTELFDAYVVLPVDTFNACIHVMHICVYIYTHCGATTGAAVT